MDALQRNHALTEYLDTLVGAGSAPEQQISFDKIQQLVKSDTIYVDNDFDDDISDGEREEAEIANTLIMGHIDEFTDATKSFFNERRRNAQAPLPVKSTPQKPQRTWNPFKSPQYPLSFEEQRLVESCAIFPPLDTKKAIWLTKTFEQVHHFRNIAQQVFNAEGGTDSRIEFPCVFVNG